ncbi:MAG: hypothetical protein K8S27_04395 [Candidatus Omnitrophica bacterium]|nr:hypothetical protein [Candidatus Omnitrophota bacterium]
MNKMILLLPVCLFMMNGVVFANKNFQQIDRFFDVAFQHARNYPPEFDSADQRAALEKELMGTIAQLEKIIKDSGPDQDVFFRLGKAHTFAYNLDIRGSKIAADKNFKKLFEMEKNHAQGHLYYGQHIVGRGESERGIEHLQIAADAGWDVALNMIGLAYLQTGQTDKARVSFQKLQKIYPPDRQIQMLLDSLEPDGAYEHILMYE